MTVRPIDGKSRRNVEPCIMVIVGATGDLTERKLVPALLNLQLDGLLPEPFAVVGASRRELADDKFRAALREGVTRHSRRQPDDEQWDELARRITYVATGNDVAGFEKLARHLDAIDAEHGTQGNRLFYLATPPSAFAPTVELLGEAGLSKPGDGGAWTRIVVEKPTGRDLESAHALNLTINRVFRERDVFRIDHYLGKETVQNLLVFRFANAIFEPLWNQKYVDHVQLTVAESVGVEDRGGYYEEAGATRDMVQNHMFQLLTLTAMEPPVSMEPDAIRDEKVKVLQALRPIEPEEVGNFSVRGQYEAGTVDGESVQGYKDEEGVAEDSRTETYVAMRLHIDNWRWADVPFYLRSGKRLNRRMTEIALQFKDVPHRLFESNLSPNTLTLRIQPDEGIDLRFDAKVPGTKPRIKPVTMNFQYGNTFGVGTPEAYERLILDALSGDSTLFIRRDEVEAAWSFIDVLETTWADEDPSMPLPVYTAGTWGPAEAHVMLAQDGRKWRRQ